MPFRKLAGRIQPAEGLLREDWANHRNGGGWVQKTAFAAETAYVGPFAIVSGSARVLDLARIVDEAMITDTAMIAGNAVVGGKARVGGNARIIGTARILGDAQVGGKFFLDRGELREGVSLDSEARPRQRPKKTVQMQLDV
jgi:carbonic anhydrase/acetyltransferase-like protein (isoleucine patch superfamily)